MSSLANSNQSTLPSFKTYLAECSLPEATKFFENLITTTQPNPILKELHNRSSQEKDIILEAVKFTNTILEYITENTEKNIQFITTAIDALNLQLTMDQNELCLFLNELLCSFKKSKIYSQFVSIDWQISVVDRKNDNVNLSKSEKIEVVTKINSYNANDQNYHSHLIKMNYNEFQEILTNFRKIDAQLHIFKQ